MRRIPVTGPKRDWTIRCPRDGAELDKVQLEDVTFDRCPRCDGAWFDRGELARIVGDVDIERMAAAVAPLAQMSTFACPRCAGDCFRTRVVDVETDACTSCRGVWLDGGELASARRGIKTANGLRGFLSRT